MSEMMTREKQAECRERAELAGQLDSIFNLIEEAHNTFEFLRDATSLGDQATAVTRMSNVMADLATWHPRWNMDTGGIDEADEVLA